MWLFSVTLILRDVSKCEPRRAIFYNRWPTTFAQENAKALAEAGGVLALVSMMNDIDEDEISKKAFTTLTSMGDIAIDVIIGHIAALSAGVEGCVGIGHGLTSIEGSAPPSAEVVASLKSVSAEPVMKYYRTASLEVEGAAGSAREEEGSEVCFPTLT